MTKKIEEKNMQFGYSCQVLDRNAMPMPISWIGQQQLDVFTSNQHQSAISMPTVNRLIPGSISLFTIIVGLFLLFLLYVTPTICKATQ